MILKTRYPSGKAWIYFDRIIRIVVHYDYNEQPENISIDERWVSEGSDQRPLLCVFKSIEGNERSILIDGNETYLLNDDGKTIERL